MNIRRTRLLPAWWRAVRASSFTLCLAAAVVILTIVVALQFIEPAPPRTLTIATGSADGAYQRFGHQLAAELEKHDVNLNVIETNGSIDNLELLKNRKVDIAFAQNGLADANDLPNVESFGSMYFEPVWIFSRTDETYSRISELKGKNIATGGAGSGTFRVAQHLLKENALTDADVRLTGQSGKKALAALQAGEVDVLITVSSVSAPMIQSALNDPELSLVSVTRAAAYARREPWLTHQTLPEGLFDLARNSPSQVVDLLTVNATLLGTTSLHPALRDLLLMSADRVFSGATLLSSAGKFPNALGSDFPLSDQARRYHENGPPFLQRYLPFWIANLVDRFKLLALPLLALLLPLSRLMPPIYRWSVRRKIYRWYDRVQAVDQLASDDNSSDHLQSCLSELQLIEKEIRVVQVPLSFANELYELRQHVELLKLQIENRYVGHLPYQHDNHSVSTRVTDSRKCSETTIEKV